MNLINIIKRDRQNIKLNIRKIVDNNSNKGNENNKRR